MTFILCALCFWRLLWCAWLLARLLSLFGCVLMAVMFPNWCFDFTDRLVLKNKLWSSRDASNMSFALVCVGDDKPFDYLRVLPGITVTSVSWKWIFLYQEECLLCIVFPVVVCKSFTFSFIWYWFCVIWVLISILRGCLVWVMFNY